jgi:hypothetical protein
MSMQSVKELEFFEKRCSHVSENFFTHYLVLDFINLNTMNRI